MTGALRSETLQHGRTALALHTLKRAPGRRLLLLHALRGSSADWGDDVLAWPGDVYALDFSGHGESDWLLGRGYAPEVFVAETDVAIARLESSEPLCVAGAGVGAYVALLVTAARSDRVAATLLLPGAGLEGGGALPEEIGEDARAEWREEVAAPPRAGGQESPDPLVRRCARDVRPAYYALAFARAAPPLWIAGVDEEPPWLAVAREHARAQIAPAETREALRTLAAA